MNLKIKEANKTALLFGATGLIGSHLLNLLLDSDAYKEVHTFSRRKLDISHPKLKEHQIDFDKLADSSKLIVGDDLFYAMGSTIKKAKSKANFYKIDYNYAYETAKIAASNKVNQFLLVSSIGADKNSFFFYNKVKGKLEESVEQLPFWATHIFRPSVLIGKRNENRFGEQVAGRIGKVLNYVSGGKLHKYGPIEADRVAISMKHAAQKTIPGLHIYESTKLLKLINP